MSSSQAKSFNIRASHKFVSSATNSCQPQEAPTSLKSSDLYSFQDSFDELNTNKKPAIETDSTRKQGSSKGMSIKSSATSIEDFY